MFSRRGLSLILALGALITTTAPVRAADIAGHSADVAEIKALGQAWQEAWNARDAAGLGAIMADDVTFVSVLGPDTPGYGRGGRAPFVAAHNGILKSPMFAKSVWRTREVNVIRFIGPDTAVAQVVWDTTGDNVRHVMHGAPRRGIFLWVLEKQGGRWRVVASQNTEAMPPLPGQ